MMPTVTELPDAAAADVETAAVTRMEPNGAAAPGPAAEDAAPRRRIEPDLKFKRELAALGAENFNQCVQCATCATVCHLSSPSRPFPRKEVLWMMWGLEDRLVRDPDIWACHYCGNCSERCPRNANPGEAMMALRRYATTRYDWTGISRLLYRSVWWELAALAVVAAAVVGLFAAAGAFGRMDSAHVALNTFIPVSWVHHGDWAMAALLAFFLGTNVVHMTRLVLDGQKVPLRVYLSQLKVLLAQATVQARWRQGERRVRWRKHFMLVTGYVVMFAMVMFLLPLLQVDGPQFTWISLAGYYATFAIGYYTVDAMIGRWRRREQMHRFSHASDWIFLILLFLTALTGILVHAFRLLDLPRTTDITYVVHLAIAVPMLVVEVPFGKWAHLMYRPLALYLTAVKERANHPHSKLAHLGAGGS
jgi:ferredoxin